MARRKDGCFHNQENRGTSKRVPPQKHVGGTSSLTEPGEPYGDLTGKLGLDQLVDIAVKVLGTHFVIRAYDPRGFSAATEGLDAVREAVSPDVL